MDSLVLGIDIGASGIKGAIVNVHSGEMATERFKIATPKPSTPSKVASEIVEMKDHFNWNGPIGCGFPALVKHGVAMTAANIDKSWINTNVEQLFSETTQTDVYVLNDADAAGMAEMSLVDTDKEGTVLFLTIGSGIGSALFTDGSLVPNTELGHLKFKGGVAEQYAADSVRKGEKLTWEEWAKRFDEYMHHLDLLFSPDRIILGGGSSKYFDDFSKWFTVNTTVLPATLLNNAGIIGAACYAGTKHHSK